MFGLVTGVIVTFDAGVGTHTALYINTPGESPFLYDPAGSYSNNGARGGNGIFEGDAANISSYVDYHLKDGSDVKIVPLATSPKQEKELKQWAREIGDLRGFSCANSVLSVLDGTCGIEHRLLPFPGTVFDKAENALCPKK